MRATTAQVVAGGVAGVLVGCSLPPLGWWPAGIAGEAVLALAVLGQPWRGRLASGAAAGVAQCVIGLWWVGEFSVVGAIALVALEALVPAAAMVVAGRRPLGFVAASTLAVAVAARWPFGGLPLATLPFGQATGPLAAVGRLGGTLAVAAATAAAGALVASAAGRRAGAALVAAGALAAALTAAAVAPDGAGAHPGAHPAARRVAAVQGGGPEGTRAVDTDAQVVFNRQLAAVARMRAQPDLIVLAEGVVVAPIPVEQTYDAAALTTLSARTGATVVAGVEQQLGGRRAVNEVRAWTPDGGLSRPVGKRRLVPFGEYVPLRSLIGGLVPQTPYDTVAGTGRPLLRAGGDDLGVMISFEVFFDGAARAASPGTLLVVPTDASSYRSGQVPAEELAAARLAAIETGRWVVQAAPTGLTAVVRPDGSIAQHSDRGATAVVETTVGLRSGRTPFDRWGDGPVLVAAAAGLLVALTRRRGRTDTPGAQHD